jgi:hypothetical protein
VLGAVELTVAQRPALIADRKHDHGGHTSPFGFFCRVYMGCDL